MVRALLALLVSGVVVLGTAGIAVATDHSVDGSTQNELHQLILSSALRSATRTWRSLESG